MRAPAEPKEDKPKSPDAAETMVAVIRLLTQLEENDQERVYLAVGQFVGIHTTLTQHVADQLEQLVELLAKQH